ncbi:MAG TPA: hypothetical protein VFT22_38280 [Kofleriaceae bacterium]|nr:hypothetical protein [Kofleriaceae bacterium]
MTTSTQATQLQQLALYAAAAATCADRYAKVFYPMIRDADEKFVCCVHGGEDMEHYLEAAELLARRGVDTTGLVERPIAERGLPGPDVIEGATSWTDRAVLSAVFERALLFQLHSLAHSGDAAIARLASFAAPREDKHVAHGMALLRKATRSPEGRQNAQDAVARFLPVAFAVLEADRSQDAFVEAVRADLAPLGLTIPERASR